MSKEKAVITAYNKNINQLYLRRLVGHITVALLQTTLKLRYKTSEKILQYI